MGFLIISLLSIFVNSTYPLLNKCTNLSFSTRRPTFMPPILKPNSWITLMHQSGKANPSCTPSSQWLLSPLQLEQAAKPQASPYLIWKNTRPKRVWISNFYRFLLYLFLPRLPICMLLIRMLNFWITWMHLSGRVCLWCIHWSRWLLYRPQQGLEVRPRGSRCLIWKN